VRTGVWDLSENYQLTQTLRRKIEFLSRSLEESTEKTILNIDVRSERFFNDMEEEKPDGNSGAAQKAQKRKTGTEKKNAHYRSHLTSRKKGLGKRGGKGVRSCWPLTLCTFLKHGPAKIQQKTTKIAATNEV